MPRLFPCRLTQPENSTRIQIVPDQLAMNSTLQQLLSSCFAALLLLGATHDAQAGSSTPRNGSGVNPICLRSLNLPRIGSAWQLEVDTSAVPTAVLCLVQGRALPSMGSFTPVGELLMDLSSAQYFGLAAAPVGGTADLQVGIPGNLSLVGLTLTIQAGIRSPLALVALCNAEDAVIGGMPPSLPDFSTDVTTGSAALRVQFQDGSSGNPDSWAWDFGDGSTSKLQDPLHSYLSAGDFTVSLAVKTGMASSSLTKRDLVHVNGNADKSNVLIVLADDIGPTDLAIYGLNPNIPAGLTPNIDALAAAGLLFERAWANPLCSPTRAMLLSGKYGFRTGIGNVIEKSDYSFGTRELTLPEALVRHADAGFQSAFFGKWHLRSSFNPLPCTATLEHGFDSFEGSLLRVADYCMWDLVSCPADTLTPQTRYQLDVLVDDAAQWTGARTSPWFCLLAPQAPFDDLHVPPINLQNLVQGPDCAPCPPGEDRTCYLAAISALDTKLGQLLASLGPNWEDETTIIFVGDNGTPTNVLDWLPMDHGKGSLFEGGVQVPMIIAGKAVDPALRGARTSALASVVDLYSTVLGIVGASGLPADAGEDSVDLGPLLRLPQGAPVRSSLFAEKFLINRPFPPYTNHEAAIRNDQYKLIYSCDSAQSTDLYDLNADPLELNNLLLGAGPAAGSLAAAALLALEQELLALMDC